MSEEKKSNLSVDSANADSVMVKKQPEMQSSTMDEFMSFDEAYHMLSQARSQKSAKMVDDYECKYQVFLKDWQRFAMIPMSQLEEKVRIFTSSLTNKFNDYMYASWQLSNICSDSCHAYESLQHDAEANLMSLQEQYLQIGATLFEASREDKDLSSTHFRGLERCVQSFAVEPCEQMSVVDSASITIR